VLILAREGEHLDMHSAMIADHIVFPVESDSIIASDIRSFAAIGVHELILDFRDPSPKASRACSAWPGSDPPGG
jgi:hypothetical protein